MTQKREIRAAAAPAEIRAEDDGGVLVIGYAAVFGQRAHPGVQRHEGTVHVAHLPAHEIKVVVREVRIVAAEAEDQGAPV